MDMSPLGPCASCAANSYESDVYPCKFMLTNLIYRLMQIASKPSPNS